MTCKGARKYLPLLAGQELPARKARKLAAHMDGCPLCHREAQGIAAALEAAKGLARREAFGDWTEVEWREMMRTVTAAEIVPRPRAMRLVRRPAFAFGLALLIFAAALMWINKGRPFKLEERGPFQARSQAASGRPTTSAGQDVVSMTFVSQETGLKIVWFFDKNFEWKENRP